MPRNDAAGRENRDAPRVTEGEILGALRNALAKKNEDDEDTSMDGWAMSVKNPGDWSRPPL